MQVPGNPFHTAQSFGMNIGVDGHVNGHQHNRLAGALNGGYCFGQKRKRVESEMMEEPRCKRCNHFEPSDFRGRNFLPVKGSANVFQSELVKPKGETMYRPLTDDVLINMRHIEQVSFESGMYFIGDHRGNYVRSDHGHVINMWRFDMNQQRLFVSRSLLFTDPMKFNELHSILQTM
ncbi:uncharacterized protein LOC110977777 [Acanthaster planci]|uniref:Uncharacterized protein LOC110977777 n=1 Tax=Acanthaster planci TaxID=133434 RepID=A0A8B7Y3X9_ACAPL|nr:uncharacterized protein LOC110977777 [Acanthaster planci]XP_022087894.1 uncharacterized protein LOC110977777 [Acanthaster planci]